jgi:hypothetical protein
MRLISRTGVIIAVLTVGAIAAPAAFADPSHSGWNPAPSGWVVGPNPDQQVAELAAAPAAHGYLSTRVVRPNPDEQLSQATSSRDGVGEAQLRAAFARAVPTHGRNVAPTSTSSFSATRARTPSGSQGFRFDDAAIGAGVIAGLTLIGMAGVLTVRRRGQLQRP